MQMNDLAKGCQRSHPHEDMNFECELKTEIARLNNRLSVQSDIKLNIKKGSTDKVVTIQGGHVLPSCREVLEESWTALDNSNGEFDAVIVILRGSGGYTSSSGHTQASYGFSLDLAKAKHMRDLLND